MKAVKVKGTAAALEVDAAALRAGKDELGKAAAGNVGAIATAKSGFQPALNVETRRRNGLPPGSPRGEPGRGGYSTRLWRRA